MHFTDEKMALEDMLPARNKSEAKEDKISSVIETCLETAYHSDSQ